MSIFLADDINKATVKPEMLREVLERVADLCPDDRGFEAHTIIAVQVVGERNLSEEERQEVTVALNFRMMALARLIEEHGAKGWTIEARDGATLIHEEVLTRAASQPLVEIDDRLSFEPKDFSEGLLIETQLGGNA